MSTRRIIIILLVVLAAIALAVLFSPKTKSHLVTVRVGYMPIAEGGPLFAGLDKGIRSGIFEKHGLAIKLVEAPGGALILDAVVGGGLDIGFSNLVSPILARSQGIDLVAIAGGTFEDRNHQIHAILVRTDSGIAQPEQLRGKTIALNTFRNIDHLMILRWLRSHGLAPQDVRLVEIPFPRMDTVLKSGEVQAIAIVEPFLTRAKKQGNLSLADYYLLDEKDRVEITTYCARRTWVSNNRDTVNAFREALEESIAYCNANERQLRDVIAKWTRQDTSLTDVMALPGFSSFPTPSGTKMLVQQLRVEGFIATTLEAADLLWRSKQ